MTRRVSINLMACLILSSCATLFGPSTKPGIELAKEGDHAGALEYFQSVIATGKADEAIYRHAYEEAFRLEKFEMADQLFSDAIKAGMDADSMQTLAIDLWYHRAIDAMDHEHWKTARTSSEKINSLDKDSKPAKFCKHMLAGKNLFDKGSTKQLWDAIGEFGLAANYNAVSGLPYLWMGRARYKNDRTNYDAALKEYDHALELEPKAPYAKSAKEEVARIRTVKEKMKKFWGK